MYISHAWNHKDALQEGSSSRELEVEDDKQAHFALRIPLQETCGHKNMSEKVSIGMCMFIVSSQVQTMSHGKRPKGSLALESWQKNK